MRKYKDDVPLKTISFIFLFLKYHYKKLLILKLSNYNYYHSFKTFINSNDYSISIINRSTKISMEFPL